MLTTIIILDIHNGYKIVEKIIKKGIPKKPF